MVPRAARQARTASATSGRRNARRSWYLPWTRSAQLSPWRCRSWTLARVISTVRRACKPAATYIETVRKLASVPKLMRRGAQQPTASSTRPKGRGFQVRLPGRMPRRHSRPVGLGGCAARRREQIERSLCRMGRSRAACANDVLAYTRGIPWPLGSARRERRGRSCKDSQVRRQASPMRVRRGAVILITSSTVGGAYYSVLGPRSRVRRLEVPASLAPTTVTVRIYSGRSRSRSPGRSPALSPRTRRYTALARSSQHHPPIVARHAPGTRCRSRGNHRLQRVHCTRVPGRHCARQRR